MAQELQFLMQLNAIYSDNGQIQKAEKEFAALTEKTKNLQQTAKNISAFTKQQQSLSQTAQKLNAAQYRVKQLATEMRNTQNPSAKLRKEFTQANLDAHKFQQALQQQRLKLGELQKSLTDAGVNTRDFATAQKDLTAQLEKTRAAQDKLTASRQKLASIKQTLSWQGLKKNIIQPALPVVGAIRPVIKASADFEAAMAGVKAVGFSGQDADMSKFENLRAQALQLGADTKFSSVQAAQTQEILMRANYSPDEVMATMPALLNMAAAERLDLVQAADILAGVKGGMNMRADQSTRISDILAYTSTTSKLDIPTLAEGLKQIAPIAAQQGVKLEQLSAMIGTLANNNFDASTISTQLRNIFLSVNDASKRQKLIELGVKTRTKEGNMTAIPEIMKQLSNKLEKVSPAEQITMLGEIFNTREVPIIQALMTASKSGQVQNYEQQIYSQNTGTAQRMSDINLNTLTGQLDILSSAWGNLKISIGDIFTPAVREGVEMLSSMLTALNSVIKDFPTASKIIIEGISILAASKTLSGILKVSKALFDLPVALISKHFAESAANTAIMGSNLATAAKSASAFGGALSLSAGQITLIISGLVLIIQHWKDITDWCKKAGEAMKNIDRNTPIQELRDKGNIADYHIRNMESAFAIPEIKAHATGGIFTRPHLGLVAEAGSEAIVPLQNKSRGISILMQAAQQLGVFPEITGQYENISRSLNYGDNIISLNDINHDITAHSSNSTSLNTQEAINPAKPRSIFSQSHIISRQNTNNSYQYQHGTPVGHGPARNIFTDIFDRISRNSNSRTTRNTVEIARNIANNSFLRGTYTRQNNIKNSKLSDLFL